MFLHTIVGLQLLTNSVHKTTRILIMVGDDGWVGDRTRSKPRYGNDKWNVSFFAWNLGSALHVELSHVAVFYILKEPTQNF
mmetsp:Transcript_80322/g.160317  ORF Transcript_80322/g.160317 Transcript_80322/m.160317 type:complete len:81 (+) Transcript_80322:867-1109(+)